MYMDIIPYPVTPGMPPVQPPDWRLSLGFLICLALLGLWTSFVHARSDARATERARLLADDALERGLRESRATRGGSSSAT
jgi:hypothetical protein